MKSNGQLHKYLKLHHKYLSDAEKLLKNGDSPQASEKLWGATATLTRAVASLRKKRIKSHDGITFFLTTIANELKDKSLLRTIVIANGLHHNFYEDTLSLESVKEGAKSIKQLSKRLCNYFNLSEK